MIIHRIMANTHQVVPEISGTVTVSSTYSYDNPETSFLTQTNSVGVVTGMPSNAAATASNGQPAVVTSQPEVATIPAGLPSGTTWITMNISSSLTSFEVSVGSSTTAVIGGAATGAQVTTGASAGVATGSVAAGSGSASAASGSGSGSAAGGSASSTASASSSSSSSAAVGNVKIASAGVIGLGAFIAALL